MATLPGSVQKVRAAISERNERFELFFLQKIHPIVMDEKQKYCLKKWKTSIRTVSPKKYFLLDLMSIFLSFLINLMSRTDHISAVWCWRSKQSTNNVQKYQLFLKRNDRELVTFKYIDYQ